MPRDGANIYHRPPGTDAVPDTTIESSKYNAYVADIEQDLNLPRPIVAGGTGASDAITAMTNLGGEIASQQVTNYDSFPFKPGSFWSAGGATSAPNGVNRFTGICTVINDGTGDLAIQATIVGTGVKYDRRKNGGVWTPWSQMSGFATDLDAAYVNVTGDTMTGDLTISHAALRLDKLAGANVNWIYGSTGGALRWGISLGNGAAESGGNAGSDFALFRYDDSGTLIAPPALNINRQTGNALMPGTFTVGSGGTTGSLYFGNTGTKVLTWDGTSIFNFTGGSLNATGNIGAGSNITTGSYFFGNSGTKYLNYDGTTYNLVGGNLHFATASNIAGAWYDSIGGANRYFWGSDNGADIMRLYSAATTSNIFTINSTGNATFSGSIVSSGSITAAGAFASSGVNNVIGSSGPGGAVFLRPEGAGSATGQVIVTAATASFGGSITATTTISATGHQCRQGTPGPYKVNNFNLDYGGGSAVGVYIDAVYMGNIAYVSDYRVKKDVIDLPGMWDTVKKLRPIKYTQAEFQPPSQVDYIDKEKAEGREVAERPMFRADNIERWGFIAHELQATLTPTASTGVKDSPDTIQSPNPFTLIAALTKALQEAMTRIEALEARVAQPR